MYSERLQKNLMLKGNVFSKMKEYELMLIKWLIK